MQEVLSIEEGDFERDARVRGVHLGRSQRDHRYRHRVGFVQLGTSGTDLQRRVRKVFADDGETFYGHG